MPPMPLIFKYFWFLGALFMLAHIVYVRRRLAAVVERGIATDAEANLFAGWLTLWFVISPIIFGVIGLVAGWPSPFCGGVMQFDTGTRVAISCINLANWASVVWWIWRGGGADFLARVAPALAGQPSYDKRYSPRLVRAFVTGLILFSSIGAVVWWRTMPPSPDLGCPAPATAD